MKKRWIGLIAVVLVAAMTCGVVQSALPSSPTDLANTTGNFWVNHTWLAGAGDNVTDSYNVSQNGTWYNGTTNLFFNATVDPHGWSNISVYAFNNSDGGELNLTPVSQNTQVSNNAPVLDAIGSKSANEGTWLNFTVHATDADEDLMTYGTNATKGALNTTTGNFNWSVQYDEAGVYVWEFNVSDGYDGLDSETITVTISNVQPTPTPISPAPSSFTSGFITFAAWLTLIIISMAAGTVIHIIKNGWENVNLKELMNAAGIIGFITIVLAICALVVEMIL